jgi:hypothetical protein
MPRRKRKHRKKQPSTTTPPPAVTTYLWDRLPAAWTPHVEQAIRWMNDILPAGQAFGRTTSPADITLTFVPAADMYLPGAWGETKGRDIRISSAAIPNPGLICHEMTHVYGTWDHGDWVNLRPCPFVLP